MTPPATPTSELLPLVADSALPRPAAPGAPVRAARRVRHPALRRRVRRLLVGAGRLLVLAVALLLLRGAAFSWQSTLHAHVAAATTGVVWDLTRFTVSALGEKAVALVQRPHAGYSDAEGAALVTGFMERARELLALEEAEERMRAEGAPADQLATVSTQLAGLRAQQEAKRATVEALIQAQVTSVLRDEGIGALGRLWPPVLFTFTESPSKVVVSPRDRIGQAAYRMIDPGLPLEKVEAIEAQVEAEATEQSGVSVYVAPTGGLGAFPTLVVNPGNLEWVLSTVAHEWAHTYLTFFPLGFSYGLDPDNILINETVADIVGDEIGRRVLERYYGAPPLHETAAAAAEAPLYASLDVPAAFDFRAEMRHTRETLDKFLAAGLVEKAEKYLELRRLLFVENGYALRRLNQAYFAFHGSYGTGPAASTSTTAAGPALAPLVEALRAQQPSVAAFLRTVRSITTRAELEQAVGEHADGR